MTTNKTPKKRIMNLKVLTIRAPEELYNDIVKITRITGISINGTVLDLLPRGVKAKLKELKE